MKKNALIIGTIILSIVMAVFGIVNYTYSSKVSITVNDVTYTKAKQMVNEVMKAYYVRGPRIQYNNAKATYGEVSPEEITSQDTKYDVCAAFICDVYTEAFGVTCDEAKFPLNNGHSGNQARDYYSRLLKDNSLSDGNFLLFYQNNVAIDGYFGGATKKYVYNPDSSLDTITKRAVFENFIKILQPGDIFFYTGHVMLVYDIVYKDGVAKDVLLMHATQRPYIPTRSTTTSRLSYNIFKSDITSNVIDIESEGGIKWAKLSDLSKFVYKATDGVRYLKCMDEDECAVIRPYYNNNGMANFNYEVSEENIKKSNLRTDYPDLFIEKIVNVGDNDSIHVGDTLTYEIKITNNSTTNYDAFIVNEEYSDMVTLVETSVSGATIESNHRTIKWNIDELTAGSSIVLTYSVNVMNDLNNINRVVTERGVFYKDESTSNITIGTGTIKNKIVPKINNLLLENKTFSSCYESSSSTGLQLIDDIYSCATGKNFNFVTDFKFGDSISGTTRKKQEGLFNKEITSSRFTENVINFKDFDGTEKFKNMILNNYWSGMSYVAGKVDQIKWSGSDASLRARTIREDDFKEGDVLIYSIDYTWGNLANDLKFTTEKGIYAYIYIDGKFVGRNGSGTTARNEFSYSYWDKSLYATNLYTGNSLLNNNFPGDENLSYRVAVRRYINYQTLFDKDYYVILRPELVIQEAIRIESVYLPKTEYILDEDELDLTGGKFTVRYNDNTTSDIDMTSDKVSVAGFDNSVKGSNTITISYEGISKTYDVNIIGTDEKDIDNNNNIIYNIEEGTTIEQLKDRFNNVISITDVSDNLVESGIVKTGYKIIIKISESQNNDYIISVKGDVNGDGIVDKDDLILSAKHTIGATVIDNLASLYAANMDNDRNFDVTTDNIIDINDIVKLTRLVKQ